MEPLLDPSSDRLALFPIKEPLLWDMYTRAKASFWVPEEIDLSHDLQDWNKLTDDERHFLKRVLGFFSTADNIVVENLAVNFLKDIQIPEARAFYANQIYMEQLHAETYAQLIDTYVKDSKERDELFRAAETIPAIKIKTDWALQWITRESATFAERLVAFACVEGIHFSASFAAIFWVRKRGLMPGLTLSNELIARDEGSHADFACALYRMLQHPLSKENVACIVREAVEAELQFVEDALPVAIIGLNKVDLKQYVEFVADRLLVALGQEKLYNVNCSLDFMEQVSLLGKTNFFEKRVADYRKAGVGPSQKKEFKLDDDF